MKHIFSILFFLTLGVNTFSQQAPCGCYTEYVAVLNQDGSATAPTATVLKNNTGQVITWYYDAIGLYYTNIIDAPSDHVIVFGGDPVNWYIKTNAHWTGVNVNIQVANLAWDYDPIPADGLLQNYPVTIRIYQ